MKVKVDPEIPERGRTRGRSKGTAEKNPKKRNQGLNCAKCTVEAVSSHSPDLGYLLPQTHLPKPYEKNTVLK